MTQKFYAIVTNLGAAKIANAAALGTKLNITQMSVGDGGGTLPTPNASQTKLVNEVRRAAINTLSVDPANASQVIAEQVIPETEGGFWIREMGLFDADGTLIAVCNTPETYKPALQEGSGRTQAVRMLIIVNSADAITLKIDPAVVLATRKYVDDNVIEVKQYADKLLTEAKKYTDDKQALHVKDENPHTQYLLIKNALKEMATAGLIPDVIKNLQLSDIALAGTMTGALSGTGYITFPVVTGGVKRNFVLQWGSGAYLNQAVTTVTLPLEFPNNGFLAVASKGSAITLSGEYGIGAQIASKSTITIANTGGVSGGTKGIFWIALGN